MMKKSIFTVSLLGVSLLVGCDQPQQQEQPLIPKLAKLYQVKDQPSKRLVHLPAFVEAAKETAVTFQVSGQVDEINLQEGEEVKQGQLLAKLDQRDYTNALVSAQADYRQAESDYQRAANLIDQNAIAKSLLDQRLAHRNKAKSALDSAQKRLEDSTLRAPYDAIVAKVHIEKHENVAPQQPIVTLLSSTGSHAVVHVPASLVIKSETEMPVRVSLELDAAPGIEIETTMFEAAAKANPSTQTFEVRYAFQPPEDLVVLPGMTGTLKGEFNTSNTIDSDVFSIPLSAVISEAGETFVWVVDMTSMTVTRRNISVTPQSEDKVSVTGISKGDILVAAGGHYLFEGATVRPYKK
ncbi:efflux RND transporter periplasmic adaptor subunit [Pseudoalteromonas luteoviolacea]|uniref:efflux RND transporter periplasmic adaptor subunit n=1 Tax=Pseudoalteromonas luteoviolacea TaxID=43657 RepID=UPI001B379D35|nr:efflux RND transporter periplasmic adaptor subunit [Pseudoalteromonas luteoviolacea]MBQ4810572.1 efflux RND transporter periplasmic adaptor subunit [Pseudoalteromonas luteoviolacea]